MNNPSNQTPQNINYIMPPAPLPTSTLAIVSLIAGLLGFGIVPLIGSIIAIVTGVLARQETRAVPPRATGDGMATAGIIMGGIQIGLAVLGVCCYLAFIFFIASSSAFNNY